MKKLVTILLLLAIFALPVAFAEVELRVGRLGLSSQESDMLTGAVSKGIIHEPAGIAFSDYNSLTSLILGLNKGEVEAIEVSDATAQYIAAQNPNLAVTPVSRDEKITYSMAFLPEKTEMADKISFAISKMRYDGSLEALEDKWITNFPVDGAVGSADVYDADGEVCRVGVTGDVPPMDYVSVDGTPAGFNVALLTEISKLIGVKFVIVPIEADARVMALTSGRIDAIFWMTNFDNSCGISEDGTLAFTINYLQTGRALVHPKDLVINLPEPDRNPEEINAVVCEVFPATFKVMINDDVIATAASTADFNKALSDAKAGDNILIPLVSDANRLYMKLGDLNAAWEKGVRVVVKQFADNRTDYYYMPKLYSDYENENSVMVCFTAEPAGDIAKEKFVADCAAAGVNVKNDFCTEFAVYLMDYEGSREVVKVAAFERPGVITSKTQ